MQLDLGIPLMYPLHHWMLSHSTLEYCGAPTTGSSKPDVMKPAMHLPVLSNYSHVESGSGPQENASL